MKISILCEYGNSWPVLDTKFSANVVLIANWVWCQVDVDKNSLLSLIIRNPGGAEDNPTHFIGRQHSCEAGWYQSGGSHLPQKAFHNIISELFCLLEPYERVQQVVERWSIFLLRVFSHRFWDADDWSSADGSDLLHVTVCTTIIHSTHKFDF